jgi:hypothetical protein
MIGEELFTFYKVVRKSDPRKAGVQILLLLSGVSY